MSKKIAVGIINCSDNSTFLKCKNSIKNVDYIFDVHHTNDNITSADQNSVLKRYISYGGLYNILLRRIIQHTDAEYIFLISSNLEVNDPTIFADYINTAKAFGTWFMVRGSRADKSIVLEDDSTKINLRLFENISNGFVFMLKSHVKNCGYFNEGFTNLNKDKENVLELYDYYLKIENKIKYLPLGYFPDTDLSLAKINETLSTYKRVSLKEATTDNLTKVLGQFYYKNKFIPGQHKTISQKEALSRLEKIQQIYSIRN